MAGATQLHCENARKIDFRRAELNGLGYGNSAVDRRTIASNHAPVRGMKTGRSDSPCPRVRNGRFAATLLAATKCRAQRTKAVSWRGRTIPAGDPPFSRSEEHTSELQSHSFH